MKSKDLGNVVSLSIFEVGSFLPRLLSILENEEYTFKLADYHAFIWNFNENQESLQEEIKKSCYLLTTSKEMRPCYT